MLWTFTFFDILGTFIVIFQVTADLSGGCTEHHTGTSVSPPLIAGFVALALEANPSLTWRDVQHILVETSSLEKLSSDDFQTNGAHKRFSHHFGYGIVNGEKLVNLAEQWATVPEQHICHYKKQIQAFPYNRFNKSTPLVLKLNTTACKGTPQYIKYLEHVQLVTTLYHYRRGATEISIVSPNGTVSWVLREREKDNRGGEFNDWKFLSTHFWGENPTGIWTISFFSKERDHLGQGFLQDIKLVLHGTEHKPGVKRRKEGKPTKPGYVCHSECEHGCHGPESHQCKQCQNYFYVKEGTKFCVEKCPANMYTLKKDSTECLPCHGSCLSCNERNETNCLTCPQTAAHHLGRCVKECPASMYKQAFDKYRFDCHMCEQRCTACTSQANNCTACGLDSILKGSTCVAKCATNQWLDGENCRLCHRTCKTCSRGGPYNCVTCPKKALNNVEDRYLYKGNQCLKSCPYGTFEDDTIMENCLDCSSNCLQCSNNGRKCDVCEVSHYRVASGDGKCVKVCPAGYYADSIRRVCEPCDMQCKSCVPGNPTACVSCLDGYFLKDHQCVMSSECQTRYYTNTTTGKCDLCPATCSFCDSADYCSACFLNYFLTPDHKCVEKCPSGTYALDRRTTCGNCDQSCSECDGPTSRDCIACAPGKYLLNSKCIAAVPAGHYSESIGMTNICKNCHHTCSKCTGPLSTDCVTCLDTLDKRVDGCINPCPGQWLSLNKCQDCHPSCQSCYGPNSDNCLQCTNDYSLNIETHTCSKSCHRKFYKDRKTNICKPCHYSCTSCFGPDENQCLTCSDKLQFHNNTCVWQCPSGWYKTFGQQCSQCSPRCKKCLYKYDLCTHCHHDKVWHDFKCYNHCGSSMFNDSSNRCYKCHDSCHACHGTAPNECTSCKASMTLFNGMCLQGCLPGFYNSSITKHCEPCMEDCLKCVETTNQLTCLVCSNTTTLLPNGKCGSKCPLGSFRYHSDNRCGICPGKGCTSCVKDQGRTCSTCRGMYELSKGLCKSTCGVGMYPDEKMNQCSECHPLCHSCYGDTQHQCKRCNDKALTLVHTHNQISCLTSCPTGFYERDDVCKPCRNLCLTCSNEDTCLSCSKPFTLLNKKCISSCPRGYYLNETQSSCLSCKSRIENCLACTNTKCIECSPGFYRRHTGCVSDCLDGYSPFHGVCIDCSMFDIYCEKCNGTQCTTCRPGFYLANTLCIKKCKDGFELRNGSCVPSNVTVNNSPIVNQTFEKSDEIISDNATMKISNITRRGFVLPIQPDPQPKKRTKRSVDYEIVREDTSVTATTSLVWQVIFFSTFVSSIALLVFLIHYKRQNFLYLFRHRRFASP